MIRTLVAAVLGLAASPALAQEKHLVFESPKGTSDADRLMEDPLPFALKRIE